MTEIAHNLQAVRQRIKTVLQASGRAPDAVKLIAVSKGKPEEDVRAALAEGQRVFGENRVQEARAKFSGLRSSYAELELHLIGPLQTNKAEEAVRLFDVIQTLDRPKLAEALAAAAKKTGRMPLCYIEVNIGGEPQKAGIAPADLKGFLEACRARHGLKIVGLMCIPPQQDDPASHFMRLKELAAQHGLPRLSMGMSGDFEEAIRCGATEIRVGTAIFGVRG